MDRFHETSRREKCPVCGHAGWCIVSNDGGTCICRRTPSGRPANGGGWIHVLRRQDAPPRPAQTARPPARRPLLDAARAMEGFRAEFERYHDGSDVFASAALVGAELGLPGAAVDRLLVGRSRFYGAWCFPMRDGAGAVVGIRLRRYGTGDKFSVAGSRDGLFYDPGLEAEEALENGVRGRELVVVEGASDCAAGYAVGLPCVGRSSCATGADALKALCARLRATRITIVADNDRAKARVVEGAPGRPPERARARPGAEGAMRLARALGRVWRIVTPPAKDLRDWVRAGCTADAFARVAGLQPWRRPE